MNNDGIGHVGMLIWDVGPKGIAETLAHNWEYNLVEGSVACFEIGIPYAITSMMMTL